MCEEAEVKEKVTEVATAKEKLQEANTASVIWGLMQLINRGCDG